MSYNKIEELIPKNTSELDKTIDHLNSHIDDIRPGASFTFDKENHRIRYSQKTKDGQETLLIPFVATVKCDYIKDDKVMNKTQIDYQFNIIDADNNVTSLWLSSVDVNKNNFGKAIREKVTGYGPISDIIINLVYDAAVYAALFRNISKREYCSEGLSLDNTHFIYRSNQIEIPKRDFHMDEEAKERLRATIIDIGSCCKDSAVITTLLLLSLISLLYEAFLKMREDQKNKVIPTFLIFIYGKSGSGKTTISRAIFNAHTSDRFISVPSATLAAMQNAIKNASSGTLLFDDIPHKGYNCCSSEEKKKLETLIRSAGDIGSEKRTARSNETVPSPKRVMTAVTSEAEFFISESSSLRCFYCPIEKGSIDLTRFGTYRDSSKYLDDVNMAFIIWAFSELLEINDDIITMPMLDTAYQKAVSDTQRLFAGVIEPRAVDNFIHLELYWQIFAPFLTFIEFPDMEISNMKSAFDNYLIKSARVQQELIKLNSAEQAVLYTVEKTITSNRILTYKEEKNLITSIITDSSDNFGASALGYYNGHYLILTSEQQRAFAQSFSEVYSEKLKKRDIIDLLYKMALVVKPIDGSVLTSKPNNRIKIRINNKDTDVIVLKYTLKGDDSDD